MTGFDDSDLICRLQAGIAERQSGVSAPAGIGHKARRVARKRTAARSVAAGVPPLAVAGVVTLLAIGAGSGSTVARGLGSGGASASENPVAAVPGGPVRAQDTAYIVKRVKASVAGAGQHGTFIHDYAYAGGKVSSDGSVVNLGWKLADVYDYTAADGTEYSREVIYQADGSPYLTMTDHYGLGVNGALVDVQTIVNPRHHVYSQTRYPGASGLQRTVTPTLFGSPSEVRQALQSGQVTQKGAATVNGAQAIVLAVTVPGGSSGSGDHVTLYVDAQTYQPLRTVTAYDGRPDLEVADWVPATPDNIAKAQDASVPAGYTKVDKAQAER